MKFLRRIRTLIVSIIVISSIFNISSAEDNKNDCQIFAILNYNDNKWFKIVNDSMNEDWERLQNITDKDSLNTAILNLKKYCCYHSNTTWWPDITSKTCQEDSEHFNDNSLDSPYLFDHLLDITMRRLNWLTWKNDIYKTMTLGDSKWYDNKWLERRQLINKHAESITWDNPQEIIDDYSKFWSQSPLAKWYDINHNVHTNFLDKDRGDFLDYIKWWKWDESINILEALKNYEERTLYDRYNNACAITEILYAILSKNWFSEDIREIRKLNNECHKIVASQISSEVEYTSLVIKRSSNLFLSNYINGYISYLENRANNLKTTWKNSSDRFLDVVRLVPMLIPECTK